MDMKPELIQGNQVKETITKNWNISSDTYDTHYGHGIKSEDERNAWKIMFKTLFPIETSKILDVGCGTGELSTLFAQMGHHVTGIDLSGKMLEKAKVKAQSLGLDINYQIGDAENPPFDEGLFDVVINRHVLWTLPHPQIALEGWKRVLKNGGRAIVIDGVWDDGSLESRLRRFISGVCVTIIDGKNVHKGYPKELKDSLPNASGTPLDSAKKYFEAAGFKNIGMKDLEHIRDVQKKQMPFRYKVAFDYKYYLIYGKK